MIFSDHSGYTRALEAGSGALLWQTFTGSSSTAPLIDAARGRVVVASATGELTALGLADGRVAWTFQAGAPLLTSPALSAEGSLVLTGSEAIEAIAINASDGVLAWRTPLQGQSLAERYPVVSGGDVFYRSQPLYFFHLLLQEGDNVLDLAGALDPDWEADWLRVRPNILSYLEAQPEKQTFFTLQATSGMLRSPAPVLYTYGDNDIPHLPVVGPQGIYLTYRARHGIQTDGGSVHVSSEYDAELGQMDPDTLDIRGLRQANYPAYSAEFRLTSDEPAVLTLGGDTLWVDNWERLGGLNLQSGALVHVGNVSNDWPECLLQKRAGEAGDAGAKLPREADCGPSGPNPFFPLSGTASDPAYPFPSPRVTEGAVRGGVVAAEGMLYWRVIEGGLAGIAHREGSTCPAPLVYTHTITTPPMLPAYQPDHPIRLDATRPLTDYILLDLTSPAAAPNMLLAGKLRLAVSELVSGSQHLVPFFLERGFTNPQIWPADTQADKTGIPAITFGANGNADWHDPAELLYSLALAYPYLDAPLQAQVKAYIEAELERYPLLEDLPWGDASRDWLHQGAPRERYAVPMRGQLNNWPPPAAPITGLYALWLWSRNTGDWSYAQAHWPQARSLFNSRQGSLDTYYANLAGAFGYARLAQHFGDSAAQAEASAAALSALQAGLDFPARQQAAAAAYLDPRQRATGWYLPVFYGMTPEVGLYLREQTAGQARQHVLEREGGDSLRWWYLTRAGVHAEEGETSYVAPIASWSHFLAHAYILGDTQEDLLRWLDRPWGRGDLYYIQKLAAALGAPRSARSRTWLPLAALNRGSAASSQAAGAASFLRFDRLSAQPVYLPLVTSHKPVTLQVNAPYFPGADIGKDRFGETAIFWYGKVSPDLNYTDVRLAYNASELYVYLAVFDRRLWFADPPQPAALIDWDAARLYLDTHSPPGPALGASSLRFTAQLNGSQDDPAYELTESGASGAWQPASIPFYTLPGWRGDALNNDGDDRGWAMTFRIPFSSLGLSGLPAHGACWSLGLETHDRDSQAGASTPGFSWPPEMEPGRPGTWGRLCFGLPAYTPTVTTPAGSLTIRHKLDGADVPDAAVGGSSICGSGVDFWNAWGDASEEEYHEGLAPGDFNIQNQADVADWPCFSRYYVAFPLEALPPGKVIISATLTLHQFGGAGAAGQAQPSLVQALRAASGWKKGSLTWNNAPLALENAARLWVDPLNSTPAWPGVPRTWDVSYAAAQAYAEGQPLRLALYSADSAYHSGKYFVSSDTGDWNAAGRPTLVVTWGNP